MDQSLTYQQLSEGDRIFYPAQQPDGSCVNEPRTISRIIEYPATRVLYFVEGGYGVADRTVAVKGTW